MGRPSVEQQPAAGAGDAASVTTGDLCRSILARHRDTVSVRNPELAVPRLQRILEAALDLSNSGGFQAMSLRDLRAPRASRRAGSTPTSTARRRF